MFVLPVGDEELFQRQRTAAPGKAGVRSCADQMPAKKMRDAFISIAPGILLFQTGIGNRMTSYTLHRAMGR
jgi:hypothetical protein